jgi:hypothetical protein
LQNETIFLKPPTTKNGVGHRQPDDELDLINLIRRTILFFSRFKFIFLGCLTVGLALGLYFYQSTPKRYSTRMIVHPWFISNQDEIEIIDSWKDLLSKGERGQLASIMNCDGAVLQQLSTISAEEILRTYIPNNPNGFLISVSVTDTSILNELQEGIVYGLNNSPFIKEKISVRKAKNMELIAKMNEEIEKLNTTKTLIDSMIRTRNASSSSLMIDISQVNAEWIDLNEKLMGYQEDLRFLSGVQVLEGFHKGKMVRSGLFKLTFLGLAAGFFIGYMISLFLYVLQKLKASKIQPVTSL